MIMINCFLYIYIYMYICGVLKHMVGKVPGLLAAARGDREFAKGHRVCLHPC